MHCSDIVFDPAIYPRGEWSAKTIERYADAIAAGETLPPIILEATTNRLLDGLHRWKAHQQLGLAEIEADFQTIPEGVPPKLYAASLSARHGDRMTSEDLKAVAREVITANPEFAMNTVARMLGVHRETVGRWAGDISEHRRLVRQVRAHLLIAVGRTQRQAATLLGVDHKTVGNDVASDISPHLTDALLTEALEGLPDECRAVADELRERLVFGQWTAEEQKLLAELRDGHTVVANLHRHGDLITWADTNGLYERIDRNTRWGNPFVLPEDGDRMTVIESYRQHYLPHKPSLLSRLDELQGKALGCWCAPEACHGDVLVDLLGIQPEDR